MFSSSVYVENFPILALALALDFRYQTLEVDVRYILDIYRSIN